MKKLKAILYCISCIVVTSTVIGCAASRALNKESPKNYDVLKKGTDRDLVRAELGAPQPSSGGDKCDVFSFVEGSGGAKYVRAVGYTVLAIGTLGISEAIFNPVEASVGKDKVRLRVCYMENSVDVVELLEIGKDPVLLEDPTQL